MVLLYCYDTMVVVFFKIDAVKGCCFITRKILTLLVVMLLLISTMSGCTSIGNDKDSLSTMDEKGISAYEFAVQNGYNGTTEEWLDSLKDKSPYEIAQSNGYVGPEAEWFNSLAVKPDKEAGVQKAEFNSKGELILTLTDKTVLNLGLATGTTAATKYTVVFRDYDGTVLKTEEVEYSYSATAPADPSREGYMFAGWDTDYTNITSSRVVTATYVTITEPAIVVDSVKVDAETKTVDINVIVHNNPGIASLKFDVKYDDILKLENVVLSDEFGTFLTTPTPYSNPQTVTLISPMEDITVDGVLATMTFSITEEVTANTVANIVIGLKNSEIYNSQFDLVDFDFVNGKITISPN